MSVVSGTSDGNDLVDLTPLPKASIRRFLQEDFHSFSPVIPVQNVDSSKLKTSMAHFHGRNGTSMLLGGLDDETQAPDNDANASQSLFTPATASTTAGDDNTGSTRLECSQNLQMAMQVVAVVEEKMERENKIRPSGASHESENGEGEIGERATALGKRSRSDPDKELSRKRKHPPAKADSGVSSVAEENNNNDRDEDVAKDDMSDETLPPGDLLLDERTGIFQTKKRKSERPHVAAAKDVGGRLQSSKRHWVEDAVEEFLLVISSAKELDHPNETKILTKLDRIYETMEIENSTSKELLLRKLEKVISRINTNQQQERQLLTEKVRNGKKMSKQEKLATKDHLKNLGQRCVALQKLFQNHRKLKLQISSGRQSNPKSTSTTHNLHSALDETREDPDRPTQTPTEASSPTSTHYSLQSTAVLHSQKSRKLITEDKQPTNSQPLDGRKSSPTEPSTKPRMAQPSDIDPQRTQPPGLYPFSTTQPSTQLSEQRFGTKWTENQVDLYMPDVSQTQFSESILQPVLVSKPAPQLNTALDPKIQPTSTTRVSDCAQKTVSQAASAKSLAQKEQSCMNFTNVEDFPASSHNVSVRHFAPMAKTGVTEHNFAEIPKTQSVVTVYPVSENDEKIIREKPIGAVPVVENGQMDTEEDCSVISQSILQPPHRPAAPLPVSTASRNCSDTEIGGPKSPAQTIDNTVAANTSLSGKANQRGITTDAACPQTVGSQNTVYPAHTRTTPSASETRLLVTTGSQASLPTPKKRPLSPSSTVTSMTDVFPVSSKELLRRMAAEKQASDLMVPNSSAPLGAHERPTVTEAAPSTKTAVREEDVPPRQIASNGSSCDFRVADSAGRDSTEFEAPKKFMNLLREGIVTPGHLNLALHWKGQTKRASVLRDGRAEDSAGLVFTNPVSWYRAITGMRRAKRSTVYAEILHKGLTLASLCQRKCIDNARSVNGVTDLCRTPSDTATAGQASNRPQDAARFLVPSTPRNPATKTTGNQRAPNARFRQPFQPDAQNTQPSTDTNASKSLSTSTSVNSNTCTVVYPTTQNRPTPLSAKAVISSIRKLRLISEEEVSLHSVDSELARFWEADFASIRMSESLWATVNNWK